MLRAKPGWLLAADLEIATIRDMGHSPYRFIAVLVFALALIGARAGFACDAVALHPAPIVMDCADGAIPAHGEGETDGPLKIADGCMFTCVAGTVSAPSTPAPLPTLAAAMADQTPPCLASLSFAPADPPPKRVWAAWNA